MIYFDHNATTPIDERVLEAMQPFLTTFYGNPSSLCRLGRVVRSAIDVAREQLASLVKAQPDQIIFTSGGTEANNLALHCVKPHGKLAISAIEHPSIIEPAKNLKKQGCSLNLINVDGDGIVSQQEIEQVIEKKMDFVSIMLANNETGVVQNIAEYAQQLGAHNVITHTDAVQALGKMPVSFQQLAVDLMSISSHKIYGPKGCGALIFRKKVPIRPILLGGGQERGYRAGTENVSAIVGFGKAAELAESELAQRSEHLRMLRKLLEQRLSTIRGLKIYAQCVERIPNTVQFSIDGIDGEMLLMKLDQKNVAVSSGSACASGGLEPSPVLVAMGIEPAVAKSSIRVSFGKANTQEEVLDFIGILEGLVS